MALCTLSEKENKPSVYIGQVGWPVKGSKRQRTHLHVLFSLSGSGSQAIFRVRQDKHAKTGFLPSLRSFLLLICDVGASWEINIDGGWWDVCSSIVACGGTPNNDIVTQDEFGI